MKTPTHLKELHSSERKVKLKGAPQKKDPPLSYLGQNLNRSFVII